MCCRIPAIVTILSPLVEENLTKKSLELAVHSYKGACQVEEEEMAGRGREEKPGRRRHSGSEPGHQGSNLCAISVSN